MNRVQRFLGAGMSALLSLAVLGCDKGVSVDNQNPKGVVGGLIVDASTMAGLEGVSVKILSAGGSFEASTGADGFYRVSDVPAGAFNVELSKMGYVTTRGTGALTGSVGNFPVKDPIVTNTTVGMLPVGPDFVVRVVDTAGAPVAGAKATLRSGASSLLFDEGSTRLSGNLIISAQSGADGRLVFGGLPNAVAVGQIAGTYVYDPVTGSYLTADAVLVNIAPMLVSGQENYQYAGGVFRYSLINVGSTLPQIVLAGPSSPLQIVESNLDWLRDSFGNPLPGTIIAGSVIDATGPITIAFSEAINPASLRAQLINENGSPGPALSPTVNLNFVSLAPAMPLTAGGRYNLILSATAALNPGSPSRQRNSTAPFFVRTAADSKPSVVSAKLSGATVTFVLSEAIGLGDVNQQSYNCVVFYEGVNFDGSGAGQRNVSGEWDGDPAKLTCDTTSPVMGVNGVGVNAGVLTGQENLGAPAGVPRTGFTKTFVAQLEQYTTGNMPPMPAAGSALPVVGTKGHLYFPRLSGTVHRTNGEPVGDIPFTLQAP